MKQKNKIFAAILGMNPQIVTESIYAILNNNIEDAPNEVYVMSTSVGIKKCIDKLITEGWLKKVYQHFNLKCPEFNETHCITFKSESGVALEDIRSSNESESSAGTIFDHIAKWCESDNNQLHLSAAGGRKASDIHAVIAMSICSRQSDRISTVYVSDPRVENTPDFFFPSQPLRELKNYYGEIIDVDVCKISIELSYINYVRLRASLPENTFCSGEHRREMISMAKRIYEQQTLEIDYLDFSIDASGNKIKLTDINFAFYSWCIEEKLKGNILASTANLTKHEAIQIANEQIKSFSTHCERRIETRLKSNIIDKKSNDTLNEIKDGLTSGGTIEDKFLFAKEWAKFKTKKLSNIKKGITKVLKDRALYELYLFETYNTEGNKVDPRSKKESNLRLEIAIKSADISIIED